MMDEFDHPLILGNHVRLKPLHLFPLCYPNEIIKDHRAHALALPAVMHDHGKFGKAGVAIEVILRHSYNSLLTLRCINRNYRYRGLMIGVHEENVFVGRCVGENLPVAEITRPRGTRRKETLHHPAIFSNYRP